MDALKAKLPGASALAKQKIKREHYTTAGKEFTGICYDEALLAETPEEKLEQVLDVINYATIWAAQLMLAIEEQQRAAWDPTHPDHVGPTYGGR
jgi:hypothetical protein